ncbi:major facilitator superfamily domain-containing protein [Dactylonectria estremocensis]|uniref:Major facilitator superfamily domain-containing protein n=1 Tax=Dactylonectria estremocensis TaxID=1079267 RepID=A0A9P9JCJ4_9HYPO|nr:major facilitator superfamily domain-containing protein [Dactylonectria estremocensis]
MADYPNGEHDGRGGIWDRSNVKPDTDHIRNRKRREQEIIRILDDIGFNWTVFIAVSAGFLASSYTIFSSNIIGPALEYVYDADAHGFDDPSFIIDMVTIGTTALGMIIFGHLADRLGRKRLYGLELLVIILGTLGMIQSSDGYSTGDGHHSLNVYAAIAAWRGIQGFGIGSEYPLSAVIGAEFSSTETRGTLMASLFAMQSVGRVLAYVVALGALSRLPDDTYDHRVAIDGLWRLVVGISAIPALLAIGLRLTIPETPRYYAGIEKDLKKAERSIQRVLGIADDVESIHSDVQPTKKRKHKVSTSWFTSARDYLFGREKAWKQLLGITLQWFLLDITFYGLGLDSPSMLHRLWLDEKPAKVVNCSIIASVDMPATRYTTATLTLENSVLTTITEIIIAPTIASAPTSTQVETVTVAVSTNSDWNQDDGDKCATIGDSLKTTATRTLLLSSIASIFGSLAAILVINRFSRRNLLAVSSGILSLLFLATGFSVWQATEKKANEVSMVFFALTQFMFNLGPNTLTFIIAAESFPTVFRGSFMGIAAAGGKLGALLIRPVMQSIGKDKTALMGILFGFSGVMLLMVGIALIPGSMLEIQYPRIDAEQGSLTRAEKHWAFWILGRLRNKSLEEIAPNPDGWLEVDVQSATVELKSNDGTSHPAIELTQIS